MAFEEPTTAEDGDSRRLRSHEGWDPEWISGRFVSAGHCENPECKQVVTATGKYTVGDSTSLDYGVPQYNAFYQVEHFSPPLRLLLLPENIPANVLEAIDRAGRVLFLDPGLAATALRASVERFLTTEGFAADRPSGGFLSLDRRLKEWRRSTGHDRAGDLFLAVKWIGNEGTHEVGDLTVADVIDGVEFIDEAFHVLFIAPDVDARARSVNERRGRLRPGGSVG